MGYRYYGLITGRFGVKWKWIVFLWFFFIFSYSSSVMLLPFHSKSIMCHEQNEFVLNIRDFVSNEMWYCALKVEKAKNNSRRLNFQHLLLAMYIYIWMLIYHIRLQNDIVCLNLIWADINLALWTTMAGLSKPSHIDSGWSRVLLCDFLEVFK